MTNYIQEFYEKFESHIRDGREFWALNFYDVLKALNSQKKEYDLASELYSLLNHEPAVYYLLEHRDKICDFLAGIRFFEEKS